MHRPSPPSHAIQRSIKTTIALAIAGTACTASLFLLRAWDTHLLIALALGVPLVLLAMLFFVGAAHAAWRAPCPHCGKRLAFPACDEVEVSCSHCDSTVGAFAGRARLTSGPHTRHRTALAQRPTSGYAATVAIHHEGTHVRHPAVRH
jgi:hypothetical protein